MRPINIPSYAYILAHAIPLALLLVLMDHLGITHNIGSLIEYYFEIFLIMLGVLFVIFGLPIVVMHLQKRVNPKFGWAIIPNLLIQIILAYFYVQYLADMLIDSYNSPYGFNAGFFIWSSYYTIIGVGIMAMYICLYINMLMIAYRAEPLKDPIVRKTSKWPPSVIYAMIAVHFITSAGYIIFHFFQYTISNYETLTMSIQTLISSHYIVLLWIPIIALLLQQLEPKIGYVVILSLGMELYYFVRYFGASIDLNNIEYLVISLLRISLYSLQIYMAATGKLPKFLEELIKPERKDLKS